MAQDWIECGRERAQQGDYVGAIAAFDRAIAENPILARAYVQRGLVYYDAGRVRDAVSDYTRAIELDETDFAAYYGRAMGRLALKNPSGARADVERALRLAEDRPAAWQLKGILCRKLNDIPAAIASFKMAARYYLDRQDAENAKRCLAAIEPLQPKSLEPKSPTVPASGQRSTPEPAAMPTAADLYGDLLDRIRHGDARGALKDLNWVLQNGEGDARTYCCRGMAHAKLGNPRPALEDFNRALQLNPDDPLARRNRGKARFQLGDRVGAMADFERALQLNPDDPLVYVAQGSALRDVGEYEAAIAAFDRALELDASCASAYLNRAIVRVRQEDTARAIADYQAAVSRFCELEDWDSYHQTLEKLNRLQAGQPSVSSSAQSQPQEREQQLRARLRALVGGQWELAERLIAQAKLYYPKRPEVWYLEKVVEDLERDRRQF